MKMWHPISDLKRSAKDNRSRHAPARNPLEIRPKWLTSDEARRRLSQLGPNATPDVALHPLRLVLSKFWTPVSCLLEAAMGKPVYRIKC
jgi:hypothetical protein